jgi:UrcA family protein
MNIEANLRKIALLAGAALLPAGALADPIAEQQARPMETETRSETVRYSVPESMTADGAVKLYHRLHAAAYRVCSSDRLPLGLAQDRVCIASALHNAVADIGNPLLSTLHQQKQGNGDKSADVKTTVAARLGSVVRR